MSSSELLSKPLTVVYKSLHDLSCYIFHSRSRPDLRGFSLNLLNMLLPEGPFPLPLPGMLFPRHASAWIISMPPQVFALMKPSLTTLFKIVIPSHSGPYLLETECFCPPQNSYVEALIST
uniref:FP944 n=1 Tax=Homo sapiens TaxID=9606 RepID=Q71RE8_HUMAN|nr:FP944 [Homo sapiens]